MPQRNCVYVITDDGTQKRTDLAEYDEQYTAARQIFRDAKKWLMVYAAGVDWEPLNGSALGERVLRWVWEAHRRVQFDVRRV